MFDVNQVKYMFMNRGKSLILFYKSFLFLLNH